MALQYTIRPISDRSPFTGEHVYSQFTVTWSTCLDQLEREFDFLNGESLVIEVDVPERGIRNDGRLRADATSASPAARIAFSSKHGPITMATDRFKKGYRSTYGSRRGMDKDWQHNVYAIAKSLEALRMVDRYGVTKRGEQYTGWKAIGSGIALGAGMTFEEAIAVVAGYAEVTVVEANASPLTALRIARSKTHPDRLGDRTAWDQVEQAARVIEAQGTDGIRAEVPA